MITDILFSLSNQYKTDVPSADWPYHLKSVSVMHVVMYVYVSTRNLYLMHLLSCTHNFENIFFSDILSKQCSRDR